MSTEEEALRRERQGSLQAQLQDTALAALRDQVQEGRTDPAAAPVHSRVRAHPEATTEVLQVDRAVALISQRAVSAG